MGGIGSFAEEVGLMSRETSKKLDFWLPLLARDVVNVVWVVCWILSNSMPVVVGVVLVEVISRSL